MRTVSPHARVKVHMSEGTAVLKFKKRHKGCACGDCRLTGKSYHLDLEHKDNVGRWYERVSDLNELSLGGFSELSKGESPTYEAEVGDMLMVAGVGHGRITAIFNT